MSNIKNYGLSGVGSNIQLGKKGGHIKYVVDANDGSGGTSPAIQFTNTTDSNLIRIQTANPLYSNDAATKLYVDNLVQGLDIKASVRVASTQNVDLSGTTPLLIDAVTVGNNYRILLKDQTDQTENGIYVASIDGINGTYSLIRSSDANNEDVENNPSSEVTGGMFTFVEQGGPSSINSNTGWVLSSPSGHVVLGTDNIIFTQFSSSGSITAGQGIDKTGNEISVKVDQTTIDFNLSDQLTVKGSDNQYHVLKSNGDDTSSWSTLSLSSDTFTGTLPVSKGGIGISSINEGDILIGSSSNTITTLPLTSDNNKFIGTNSSGDIQYQYVTRILDTNGNIIIDSSGVTDATDYFTFQNSLSGSISILSNGVSDDIDISISPKGNGLLVAKSGYDEYIKLNENTISDETFITKGFVNYKFGEIDNTQIQNTTGSSYASTNRVGFEDKVIIGSNFKNILEIEGSISDGVAESGERLKITHITDEVQLRPINNSGTGNVDLRIIPQNQGQVYIGENGNGLIQSEPTFDLTLKSGDGTSTTNSGDITILGGAATSGDTNGGNVYIRGGVNAGTGTRGRTVIQDDRQANIAIFTSPTLPASNFLEFRNSISDTDPLVSGVKIMASPESSSGNVSIILDPKGIGLVRVSDVSTYNSELSQSGQNDALVTKSYLETVTENIVISAGTGLTNNSGTFDINLGANTISVNGSDNLIVNSSNVSGQILISSGTIGTEAVWGSLDISSSGITGVLLTQNGGTGLSGYSQNDILVGNNSNELSILSKGSNNSFLGINSSGNVSYNYVQNVRDSNGNIVVSTGSITSPVNNMKISNSSTGNSVVLESEGTDSNIDISIITKGTGLLRAREGYTADIIDEDDIFVTKGYVDSALTTDSDSYTRIQTINSGWDSVMNISDITPNISSKNVYIYKTTLVVSTVISGGNTTFARITDGTNEIMSIDENDIQQTGIYVSELPFSFASNSKQLVIEFYQNDMITPSIPTSGNIRVIVDYKIV